MKQEIPKVVAVAVVALLSPYCANLSAQTLINRITAEPEPLADVLRSRDEAMRSLRVSMPTLDRMIQSGELTSRRIRRRVLVPQSAIDAIIHGEVRA